MTDFVLPNYDLIAGVDEVGRGPLVGNVVTAAVILDPLNPIEGLRDSKKLSEKKRNALVPLIKERAIAWSLGFATPQEIDELNILNATMLAMFRAIEGLKVVPEFVFVDGNRLPPQLTLPAQAIVKGDALVPAISAASILAKVVRDDEMYQLHERYPDYGFDQHKGYPTKLHLEKLQQFGVLSEHRKSFSPVKKALMG